MIDQNDVVQLKQIFPDKHHIHSGSDTPRIDYRNLTNSPIKLGFGGDGSDGDLIITSGTTTISLGSAKVVVKNYRYLSVTGTASIAFSNPNSAGTIVMFLVSADYTVTSTTNPAIDLRSIGGTPGNGATGGGGAAPGGGGGASASTDGTASGGIGGAPGTAGTNGTGYGIWIPATSQTGGGSVTNGTAPGGTSPQYNSAYGSYAKAFLIPGSGGGGGSAAAGVGNGTGGGGGRGGGALYVECAGRYLVTSTINLAGANGADGVTKEGGGGGGGGGGSYVALYNILVTNTGIYTVTGGSGGAFATGGTASSAGGAGAAGYSLVAKNTIFA